ncbi:hypothetical protein ACOSP7_023079 [Xanthoceras sorbifolium]
MEATVLSYFVSIFSSPSPPLATIGVVVDSLDKRISSAAYKHLDSNFSGKDVRKALFQMTPSKAPGLDWLTAGFYQRFWNVVSDKVTAACLRVLNDGYSIADINSTLIVLIPKVDRAESMGDFRSISLYNFIYKEAHVHGSLVSLTVRQPVPWLPPTAGTVKLITDASICSSSGFVGLGFIIHDSSGLFLVTGAIRMHANFSPQYGLALVHVEFDSLSVINTLLNQFIPPSDLGLIIYDILHFNCFSSIFSFSFVYRSANMVVDAFVKVALVSNSDSFLV